MTDKPNDASDQSNIYQIKVKGHLDSQWSDWFDNLTVTTNEDGTTYLTGLVVDDAVLHGLLKKVRDSGMRLLAVNRIESDQAETIVKDCSDGD